MAERKVINKYYPPDFDPSKIPRGRKKGTPQVKVRMMLPMSVRCTNCGEYLYQGKKFNSRKETVWDESYLGLKVFRFYIKCPTCAAELTMKTDPKNSRYNCEHNCTRNYEAWHDPKAEEEAVQKEIEEQETDAMRLLENKSNVTKLEMEKIDDLDEIKTLNALNEQISVEDLLQKHLEKNEKKEEQVDVEEELKKFYSGIKRVKDEKKKDLPVKKIQKTETEKKKIDLLGLNSMVEDGEMLIVKKKKKKKKNQIGSLVDY
eukprot:gene2147-2013_t